MMMPEGTSFRAINMMPQKKYFLQKLDWRHWPATKDKNGHTQNTTMTTGTKTYLQNGQELITGTPSTHTHIFLPTF